MRRAAAALVLAAQAVTVTDAVPAAPRRGLQTNPFSHLPLNVGSFCRRKCDDGSEPTIDRAADCPAGTLCQSPDSVVAGCVDPLTGGGCGTCGLRAYVCREQISASCNIDVFKKTFCPQLAGDDEEQGYDMNAYACAHDPSGAGGILRGMPGVGRTSEMYGCYTTLVSAGAFDGMATFEAFCPAECDPNHDRVAPSGPALPPTPTPTKQGSLCDELRQTALDEEATGMVGEEVADCDEQGDFMPVQCNGSIGSCWCVDGATGVAVPGTMQMCRGPTCGVTVESCLNGGRMKAPPLPLGCCTSMGQRNCVPCGALAPPPPTYHPTPPPPPGKGHCAAGTQYCAALGYCAPTVPGMNCDL